MRGLSESFLADLKNDGGILHPILERVKRDDTLMLAIRDNYINIYYRGGNILRIKWNPSKKSYQASFDAEYNKTGYDLPAIQAVNKSPDPTTWIQAFPALKEAMDFFFSKHKKPEREFQQLVARENNYSTISNRTEYFISDIELADSGLGARFDMLAILWPASQRKNGSTCRAALIEMKYADEALDDKAGLLKHLQDMDTLVSNSRRYTDLLRTMETQFHQLDDLGLLKYNRCKNGTKVKLDDKEKPEVVFVLANHNPRSKKLGRILNDPEILKYAETKLYDLKFHVAQFSGYGMHSDGMLDLADIRKLL